MERRGLQYDRALLKPLMAGKSIQEGVVIMKRYFPVDEPDAVLSEERMQLISGLFEEEVNFIPGFIRFHEALMHERISTCIATSMHPALMPKIDKRLNIKRLFEGRVYHVADAGNRSKPDPAVFLYAARKMNVRPEQCLVIEDAPHGIAAAKSAGMSCWSITTTFQSSLLMQADRVFANFDQIAADFFG